MLKLNKKLLIMFILLIFALTITVNATDINMNLDNNSTTTNTVDNSVVDNNTINETSNNTSTTTSNVTDTSYLSPIVTTSSTQNTGLGLNNILNVLLIVIGLLLVFLAIAIILRLKNA